VAFLASEGAGTFAELTDVEDGPTLSQLLTLNVEVGRLSLAREKATVNATVIALTSILDAKVLTAFNKNIDDALAATDVLGTAKQNGARAARFSSKGKRAGGVSGVSKKGQRSAVQKTMHELNKLNVLMGG